MRLEKREQSEPAAGVASQSFNGSSLLTRRPNSELRPREHLTEREVEKLIAASKGNRYGARDSCLLLVGFRHGLRASELCELHGGPHSPC